MCVLDGDMETKKKGKQESVIRKEGDWHKSLRENHRDKGTLM